MGLPEIAKKRLDSVEQRVRAFQRSLGQVAGRWKNSLIGVLTDPEKTVTFASSVQQMAAVQSEVHAELIANGYEYWARRVANGLVESQHAALDSVAELELPHAVRLSDIDQEGLNRLQNMAFRWLDQLGVEAASVITRGVIQSALSGLKKGDMIENVRQAVDARLVNYASTYVDTALATYDREVHGQVYEAAGVEKFIYVGPLDIKTRPFCRKLLDHGPYTRAEIAKLENGTKLNNVWSHGAGWNCRHIWMPAPEQRKESQL